MPFRGSGYENESFSVWRDGRMSDHICGSNAIDFKFLRNSPNVVFESGGKNSAISFVTTLKIADSVYMIVRKYTIVNHIAPNVET
jgi:hypothetical protein